MTVTYLYAVMTTLKLCVRLFFFLSLVWLGGRNGNIFAMKRATLRTKKTSIDYHTFHMSILIMLFFFIFCYKLRLMKKLS